jgi:hypothetical protein
MIMIFVGAIACLLPAAACPQPMEKHTRQAARENSILEKPCADATRSGDREALIVFVGGRRDMSPKC